MRKTGMNHGDQGFRVIPTHKKGTEATQAGRGSECTGIMRVLGPNGFLSPGRYDIG